MGLFADKLSRLTGKSNDGFSAKPQNVNTLSETVSLLTNAKRYGLLIDMKGKQIIDNASRL